VWTCIAYKNNEEHLLNKSLSSLRLSSYYSKSIEKLHVYMYCVVTQWFNTQCISDAKLGKVSVILFIPRQRERERETS